MFFSKEMLVYYKILQGGKGLYNFYIYVHMALWLLSLEMDSVSQVQNLDKAVCTSLDKGMNPPLFPPILVNN